MSASPTWSHGYTVSSPYPAVWHFFQSPSHLSLLCALQGVVWEVGPGTPLTILDVGCGTGYAASVLAASNPQWRVVGLDYNPAHVAEGRSLAAAAQLENFQLLEADLAALDGAALDALPEADLVCVHGLWSWVSDAVREGILRLLRRKAKPGGLVLMTYNCMPGAAGALGLARLARQVMRGAPSPEAAVAALSEQVRVLHAAEPEHLPPTGWRQMLLGTSKTGLRPDYLLHEFTTEHWRPAFQGDVAAALDGVGCGYVGSASLDENIPMMTLSPSQQAIHATMPDEASRQLLIDFCVGRPFRRDVYMRGLRRETQRAALPGVELVLAAHHAEPLQLRGQAGVAELPEAIVAAVRARLAEGPASVEALCALPGCANVPADQLVTMLVGSGLAERLWRRPGGDPGWNAAIALARRFNRVAAERLAPHGIGAGQKAIASPALGGGMAASSLELAVSQVMAADPPEPATPAAVAGRLLPPGHEPPEEARAELEEVIGKLLQARLPVWRALGMV